MTSSFKQKKMKTLVTRKKTRKRRMQSGMTHEDDSGRLFQPPSQRDPRWKKSTADSLVRSIVQNKRQKTAHVSATNSDNDSDEENEDDGFDVVAAPKEDFASSAESEEDEDAVESEPEEYDEDNFVKHPLQYCTSLDDCVAKAAVQYQQIRKMDGRQKAKVLLMVETPVLRKALKTKLNVKQELVKGTSRIGIKSVKANSMQYKNIAILKTPMERFEEANTPLLKDFKMGKLATLIAEDASYYPYSDLKLNKVVFLAKTAAAAINLDRSLLTELNLHVLVVNDGAKSVTDEQKQALKKFYAVKQ
uniref:Uncharacterized protein n=1 Tax=Globisporangium ultimum (strain ATCC 200006 / CBS 805.95 / DAOM BR144) TaxID=431595 RepID=K3WMH3_GLOUD